jgi:hypothetical protein
MVSLTNGCAAPTSPAPGSRLYRRLGYVRALRARARRQRGSRHLILKPEVFTTPRLGSMIVHCGKVPEYRGAAPRFGSVTKDKPRWGSQSTRSLPRSVSQPPAGDTFPPERAADGTAVKYVGHCRRNVLPELGRCSYAQCV